MSKETEAIISRYAAATAYEEFEKFSADVRGRRAYWNSETLPTIVLERIARNKPEVAKEIFEFACVQPLITYLREGDPSVKELSEHGEKYLDEARSRFTQEPGWAMGVLEGVLILELVEPWAEKNMFDWSSGKTTLAEYRKKSLTDSVGGWIDKVYNGAYEMAQTSLARYVQRRAMRIALVMAAMIDGAPLTELEVKEASGHQPPPKPGEGTALTLPAEPITDAVKVVKYVLGLKPGDDIPF